MIVKIRLHIGDAVARPSGLANFFVESSIKSLPLGNTHCFTTAGAVASASLASALVSVWAPAAPRLCGCGLMS